VVDASLFAYAAAFPLAAATSTCRSKLTVCCGVIFFLRAIQGSSRTRFSHSNWHETYRALQSPVRAILMPPPCPGVERSGRALFGSFSKAPPRGIADIADDWTAKARLSNPKRLARAIQGGVNPSMEDTSR
jgi:hypothetical protein